jgi:hypothetical protein
VSKDGKSSRHLLVVLRVLETTTGSLQPLLALRAGGGSAAAAGGSHLVKQESDDGGSEDSGGEGEGGSDGGSRGRSGGARRAGADSPELHERLDSRLRTAQWLSGVREGDDGPGDGDDEDAAAGGSPKKGRAGPAAAAMSAGSPHSVRHRAPGGLDGGGSPSKSALGGARGGPPGPKRGAYDDEGDEDADSGRGPGACDSVL